MWGKENYSLLDQLERITGLWAKFIKNKSKNMMDCAPKGLEIM